MVLHSLKLNFFHKGIFIKYLKQILSLFFNNKFLIIEFIKRDVSLKYKGTFLGFFWSFLTPLIMVTIYTVVFSKILTPKWNVNFMSEHFGYGVILYAGLIILNFFNEIFNKSTSVIKSNKNYVKRVVFPLEAFAIILTGSALFQLLINLIIITIIVIIFDAFNSNLIYIPFIILPLIIFCIGASWIVSSISVFLQDTKHVVSLISSVLIFISPIFYPISAVPEKIAFIIYLNPLSIPVENLRNVLIFGLSPDIKELFYYFIFSCMFALVNFFIFIKLKKRFSDVI